MVVHPSLEAARRNHEQLCQCDLCVRADAAARREPPPQLHICFGIGEDAALNRLKCSLTLSGRMGGKGACNRKLGHDGLHRDRKGREFDVALSTIKRRMREAEA